MTSVVPEQSALDRANCLLALPIPSSYADLEIRFDEIGETYIALLKENSKTRSSLSRAKNAYSTGKEPDGDRVTRIQFNYDNRVATLEHLKLLLGRVGRKCRNFDEIKFIETAQKILPKQLFNEILSHAKGGPPNSSATQET